MALPRWRHVGVALGALAMASCVPPPARAPGIVAVEKGFVLSTSPMVVEDRVPELQSGFLELTYAFWVKNSAPSRAAVELPSARFRVAGQSWPARCAVGAEAPPSGVGLVSAPSAILAPSQARGRIECRVRAPVADLPQRKDFDGSLELTLVVGDQRGVYDFDYPFVAEDLE